MGIDNNMRKYFFGDDGSVSWNADELKKSLGRYTHFTTDIRDAGGIDEIFAKYGKDVSLVVHTAAQPSHDWAAREPMTDFSINATGTLTLLEATRKHCPDAVFIFTSTIKFMATPQTIFRLWSKRSAGSSILRTLLLKMASTNQ